MELSVEKISKTYNGRYVVKDLTLRLKKGEIVGLLGPNGAGKTTTFHIITGFVKPDRGRIYLLGEDITDLPVYKRARLGIGYLSQEPSVFRKLTVEENLRAILELLSYPKKEISKITENLLTKLAIKDLRKQKASTLSGGERRRLEIARALVTNPHFLLLDEPFTGIDPIVRAEIQDIIKRLKAEGMGIFLTDHNVRETLEITDYSYLIYDARILFFGRPNELINDALVKEVYLGTKFKI